MGPTGAGKSNFINTATCQDGRTVGHGMESYTSKIRAARVKHPVDNYPVVFVDTPGLDDTYKSDIEILTTIANWLVTSYERNANIATIVYLHRITDNRMSGSLLENLGLFTRLCGQEAMPNIVIATTMWGQIDKKKGLQRENELSKEYLGHMRDRGCRVERFEDTYDSAWHIIGSLGNGRAEAENKRRAQAMKGRMTEIKADLRKNAHEERKKRKGISALFHKLFGGNKD